MPWYIVDPKNPRLTNIPPDDWDGKGPNSRVAGPFSSYTDGLEEWETLMRRRSIEPQPGLSALHWFLGLLAFATTLAVIIQEIF